MSRCRSRRSAADSFIETPLGREDIEVQPGLCTEDNGVRRRRHQPGLRRRRRILGSGRIGHRRQHTVEYPVRAMAVVGLAGCVVLAASVPLPSLVTGAAVLAVGVVGWLVKQNLTNREVRTASGAIRRRS